MIASSVDRPAEPSTFIAAKAKANGVPAVSNYLGISASTRVAQRQHCRSISTQVDVSYSGAATWGNSLCIVTLARRPAGNIFLDHVRSEFFAISGRDQASAKVFRDRLYFFLLKARVDFLHLRAAVSTRQISAQPTVFMMEAILNLSRATTVTPIFANAITVWARGYDGPVPAVTRSLPYGQQQLQLRSIHTALYAATQSGSSVQNFGKQS